MAKIPTSPAKPASGRITAGGKASINKVLEKSPWCTTWSIMDSSITHARACSFLARQPDRRSKRGEASGNCGNARIGESVEISASDGGPCRPSQMAPIAGMSRPCDSIACKPAGGTPKSDSDNSASVRSRTSRKPLAEIAHDPQAPKTSMEWASDEGGADRVGLAQTCGNSARGWERGTTGGVACAGSACSWDVETRRRAPRRRESGALIRAGIACTSAAGTSKSDSESSANVRGPASAMRRESGALIRAGVACSACGKRSVHRRWAGIACTSAAGTPKSDSESSASIRSPASAVRRKSGALIRAGVVCSACGKTSGHRRWAGIARTAIVRTSKSDSESSASVQSPASAVRRESGALIRAGAACSACGKRSGHRHWAGIACARVAYRGTPKFLCIELA